MLNLAKYTNTGYGFNVVSSRKQPSSSLARGRSLAASTRNKLVAFALIAVVAFSGAYIVSSSRAAGAGWMSGISFDYATAQQFASWRGSNSPLTMLGCWDDQNAGQPYCLTGANGFSGSIDVAPGWLQNGSSLASAATGSADSFWKSQLDGYYNTWGSINTVYLRPAHEMNSDFSTYGVHNATDAANFKKAWVRYYNLVQSELVNRGKKVKMVMGYNWDSGHSVNIDTFWPGDQYVDVVGADFYDADWSTTPAGCYSTTAKLQKLMTANDRAGWMGPEAWRTFAASHGKPVSFPEWGMNNSGNTACDDTVWVQTLHDFMASNAGTGSGQFIYDIYFDFRGYGTTHMWPINESEAPKAAALYKTLTWGSAAATTTPAPTAVPTPAPTAAPTPTPAPTTGQISQTNNLVSGKRFTSTVGDSTSEVGNPIANTSDGNESTRWISLPTSPASARVDLGSSYTLNKVSILWAGDTVQNYKLQTSTDGNNWNDTSGTLTTTQGQKELANITTLTGSHTGRYLQIVMTSRWNADYGNSIWEIGAYGSLATSTQIQGDVDNNGHVNVFDLSVLLSSWGASNSPSDWNGDGTVNVFDLSVLLTHWTG